MKHRGAKKSLKKNEGASFVELIVYISISAILLLSISSFLLVNEKSKKRNQVVSEVEIEGAQIVRTVTQSVRNAKSVASPPAGGSGATLSITTDDASKNPTVFSLSNGKIRIKEGSSSAVDLNSEKVEISGLNFKNAGLAGTLGSVSFEFKAEYKNPGGNSNSNYSKMFYGAGNPR